MEKTKNYFNVKFNSEVINKIHKEFLELSKKDSNQQYKYKPNTLRVYLEDETWELENLEEFLSMIQNSRGYYLDHILEESRIIIEWVDYKTYNKNRVLVAQKEKYKIDSIFNIIEENIKNCLKEPEKMPFKIFIGHGKDIQWRDLKDHLVDMHKFNVICYEIGPKAGITIKDKLESMLDECDFALLVFTGEDIDIEGQPHARENVIHELGLFQGRLGFDKALILLEDGVKEFSNIVGINQYRFSKGNIKEIFGDIVATLNKEITEI